MKTVLVTGGSGAIGSNLCRRLLDDGCHVVVLDDLSSGSAELLDRRAVFVRGSVCNAEDINEAFSHKPQFVFHLAALFANQNSVDHPEKDLSVNGGGTLNVLRAASDSGVEKLLFTSSSCVYGNQSCMREDAALGDLDTPYAMTKYLGDQYCKFWTRFHGLDTVMVRLFNSYGPGEFPGKYRNVIPNFLRLAIRGEPLPITGTGDEVRDFNFAKDAVDGMCRAMFSTTKPGDVFNIAGGRGTKIADLAAMINRVSGNPSGVTYIPSRKWDSVVTRIGIIDKAKAELGYMPKTSLEDGIAATYEWMRCNSGKLV
jgi:UDP-glucose 4-epimerase